MPSYCRAAHPPPTPAPLHSAHCRVHRGRATGRRREWWSSRWVRCSPQLSRRPPRRLAGRSLVLALRYRRDCERIESPLILTSRGSLVIDEGFTEVHLGGGDIVQRDPCEPSVEQRGGKVGWSSGASVKLDSLDANSQATAGSPMIRFSSARLLQVIATQSSSPSASPISRLSSRSACEPVWSPLPARAAASMLRTAVSSYGSRTRLALTNASSKPRTAGRRRRPTAQSVPRPVSALRVEASSSSARLSSSACSNSVMAGSWSDRRWAISAAANGTANRAGAEAASACSVASRQPRHPSANRPVRAQYRSSAAARLAAVSASSPRRLLCSAARRLSCSASRRANQAAWSGPASFSRPVRARAR